MFTFLSLLGTTVVITADNDIDNITLTKTVLGLTAKFFISASWGNIMLFTIESYPTVIRSSSYGFVSFISRIGGILAPQNKALRDVSPHLPYSVNAALQLASALACLLLS